MPKGNKNMRNVPNLRFPEFQGEWGKTMFDKICTITTGNKNTQDKIEDGIYPFYVRSSIIERINSYTFDGEAVLTAGDGVGVGKVFHYVKGKIGVHQRVYILSNFKCDGKFSYYYFSSRFYNRVRKMSAKNSVDSVRHDMIAKMSIMHPERKEQQKIAAFLSLIDERIQTQNKIIEKYESLIRGLNNSMFCQNKNAIPKLRFPGFLGNWNDTIIGKMLKIGNGRDYKHLNKGTVPVFGTGGYMTSVDDYLHEGDSVCIGRKGTINSPIFLSGKFWTVDTLFYTHSFKNVLPRFCFYVFNHINWLKYNEASGVPSLSKTTIESIHVSTPSFYEQEKIAKFLTFISDKIEMEKSVLLSYQKQKNYLLRNLFV